MSWALKQLSKLPEFLYRVGDSRSNFLDYVESLQDVTFIRTDTPIIVTCSRSLKRASVIQAKTLEIINEKIQGDFGWVVFPVYLRFKKCNPDFERYVKKKDMGEDVQKSRPTTIFAVAVNLETKEYEIWNPRYYTIPFDDFNVRRNPMKLIIHKLKNKITKLNDFTFEKESLYIPEPLFGKLKEHRSYVVYPMFLLTYIYRRIYMPDLSPPLIVDSILSKSAIKEGWRMYVDFNNENYQPIITRENDKITVVNPETMAIMTKEEEERLRIHHTCGDNQMWNKYAAKCMDVKESADIDILLDVFRSQTKVKKEGKNDDVRANSNIYLMGLQKEFNRKLKIGCSNYSRVKSWEALKKKRFIWKVRYDKGKDDNGTVKFKIPEGYDKEIKTIMKKPVTKRPRFLAVFAGMYVMDGKEMESGHSNVLLFDLHRKEVELYDPTILIAKYLSDEFAQSVSKQIAKDLPEFKFFGPKSTFPREKISFSNLAEYNMSFLQYGACLISSIWWIEMRIRNPNIDRSTFAQMAFDELQEFGNYSRYILLYVKHIRKQVKKLKKQSLVDFRKGIALS
jgi:hypothetical protein